MALEGKNDYAVNHEEELVRQWLSINVRLPEYTERIIENGFDRMDVIARLSVTDLEPMGITKVGHKKVIMDAWG